MTEKQQKQKLTNDRWYAKHGRTERVKAIRSKQSAEYYKANTTKVRAGVDAYAAENPEKVAAAHRKWRAEHKAEIAAAKVQWRKDNPAARKVSDAAFYARHPNYPVTQRRLRQSKVAGRPCPELCEECGRGGKICFEHCHATNKFRGWVCHNCNMILAHAKDSPELLLKSARYLHDGGIASRKVAQSEQLGWNAKERKAGRRKPSLCEQCGKLGRICFEHDHKTGKFRGWLCHSCNMILGYANDDPDLLVKLAKYLKRNRKP